MKGIASALKSKWSLVATIAAGGVALVFLPHDAFRDVTQELMALFGLMMAAVLPTMVLTASVLRAGSLSVKRITAYRDALRRQMLIWIGLFVISLVGSLLIIIGKMLNWTFVVDIPLGLIGYTEHKFDLIKLVNCLIVAALATILFRALSVGNGIISLLGLSADLALGEAQDRDDKHHKSVEAAIDNMSERPSYGQYTDLKH